MTQLNPKKIKIDSKKISNQKLIHIRNLRKRVLYKKLPNYYSKYPQDNFPNTKYINLYVKKKIVSTLTFFPNDLSYKKKFKSIQIRGMATDERFQNRGYGAKIIFHLFDYALKNSFDIIWCNARKESHQFYKSCGFTKVKDYFFIRNIGLHILMFKKL